MKPIIEIYRGIEITFDTERERFSFSLDESKWHEKQSYSACKKAIDDYKKANQEFKSFMAINQRLEKFSVVGIRKDNCFVRDDGGGKLTKMSDYMMDYVYIYRPEDQHIYDEIKRMDKESKRLNDLGTEMWKNITAPTLLSEQKKYIV